MLPIQARVLPNAEVTIVADAVVPEVPASGEITFAENGDWLANYRGNSALRANIIETRTDEAACPPFSTNANWACCHSLAVQKWSARLPNSRPNVTMQSQTPYNIWNMSVRLALIGWHTLLSKETQE